jgi:hypothetical protein
MGTALLNASRGGCSGVRSGTNAQACARLVGRTLVRRFERSKARIKDVGLKPDLQL